MVSISSTGSALLARVPYAAEFAGEARKIGGRWNAADKVWIFDPRDESNVRELCRVLFGTSGVKSVSPRKVMRRKPACRHKAAARSKYSAAPS